MEAPHQRRSVKCQVHLADIANNELLKKGLYRVEARLTCSNGDAAQAVSCKSQPLTLQSQSRGIAVTDSELGADGALLQSETAFSTRSVFLRFTDETFELRDVVDFDLELPASVAIAAAAPVLQLQLDLLRCEVKVDEVLVTDGATASSSSSSGTSTSAQHHGLTVDAGLFRRGVKRTGEWTVASSRTLRFPVPAATAGLHATVPVVWDSMSLASCLVTVHATVSAVRLHKEDRPARPALMPVNWPATLEASTSTAATRTSGGEARLSRQEHTPRGSSGAQHQHGELGAVPPPSGLAKDHGSAVTAASRPASARPTVADGLSLSRFAGMLKGGGSGSGGGGSTSTVAGAGAAAVSSSTASEGPAGLLAFGLGKVSRGLNELGQGLLQGLFSGKGGGSFSSSLSPFGSAAGDGGAGAGQAFPSDGPVPAHIITYLNTCAAMDAKPHTMAEALFPSFGRLRASARAARLSHLYGALLSGYLALAEEDMHAADGAFTAAEALADSIDRREAVEAVVSVDQVAVSADAAQAAHEAWLRPLVQACVRLRCVVDRLSHGAGDDGRCCSGSAGVSTAAPLAALTLHPAGTYCSDRFGPRSRHPPFACSGGTAAEGADEAAAEAAGGVARHALCGHHAHALALELSTVRYGGEGEAIQGTQAGTVSDGPGGAVAGGALSKPDALGLTHADGHAVAFVVRAAPALRHAESAAAAIVKEQALLERKVSEAWRALQSCNSRHRLRVEAMLQAEYKALAVEAAREAMVEVEEEADDRHVAFVALSNTAGHGHRRQSVQRQRAQGKRVPCLGARLPMPHSLDPLLYSISEHATARVTWYVPPAPEGAATGAVGSSAGGAAGPASSRASRGSSVGDGHETAGSLAAGSSAAAATLALAGIGAASAAAGTAAAAVEGTPLPMDGIVKRPPLHVGGHQRRQGGQATKDTTTAAGGGAGMDGMGHRVTGSAGAAGPHARGSSSSSSSSSSSAAAPSRSSDGSSTGACGTPLSDPVPTQYGLNPVPTQYGLSEDVPTQYGLSEEEELALTGLTEGGSGEQVVVTPVGTEGGEAGAGAASATWTPHADAPAGAASTGATGEADSGMCAPPPGQPPVDRLRITSAAEGGGSSAEDLPTPPPLPVTAAQPHGAGSVGGPSPGSTSSPRADYFLPGRHGPRLLPVGPLYGGSAESTESSVDADGVAAGGSDAASLTGHYIHSARSAPGLEGGAGADAAPADVDPLVLSACPEVTGDVHVVVFLNGLGGSVHDTRILRALLKVQEPHILCYGCTSNQGAASEGELVEAGCRVALEVARYLNDRQREDDVTVARVSFVAFSLGGVVARIALRHPALQPYSDRLHAFVSIASPHLGLLFTTSVVSTSLYLLQQVRATPALAQLTLADGAATVTAAAAAGVGEGGAGGGAGGSHAAPVPGFPPRHMTSGAAASSTSSPARKGVAVAGAAGAHHAHHRHPSGYNHSLAGPFSEALLYLLCTGWADRPVQAEGDSRSRAGSGASSARTDRTDGSGGGAGGSRSRGGSDFTSSSFPAAGMSKDSVAGGGAPLIIVPPASARRGSGQVGGTTATPTHKSALQALRSARLRDDPNGIILGQFRHVLLLGSPQDSYSPYHSAMAGMTPVTAAAAPHSHHGQGHAAHAGGGGSSGRADTAEAAAYRHMLHGFWHGVDLSHTRVGRVSVRFPAIGATLSSRLTVDSVLGRQAHVAFLETEAIAALITVGFRQLWAPQDVLPGLGQVSQAEE